MRADEARVVQAGVHIVAVALGALLLAACGDETGVEHAAVERTEVELAVDHGLVNGSGGKVAVRPAAVDVHAHHVTVTSGGAVYDLRSPCDAAAEVEMVGKLVLQDGAYGGEVLLRHFGHARLLVPRELVVHENAHAPWIVLHALCRVARA